MPRVNASPQCHWLIRAKFAYLPPAESHLTQHSSPGKNRGYRAQSHVRVTTPPARRAGLLGSCPCSDVISWPSPG
ncbi:hypothetical protein XFF6992_70034 [Xanthomonas citri pv. fuscans]|nr:hypothetical protein XFF6992_70034 [Xanthomonas citri pv. fuscans]SOO34876.1 hypothetical protein XFF6994_470039 [Xanthomonas citri pv. fuscans]